MINQLFIRNARSLAHLANLAIPQSKTINYVHARFTTITTIYTIISPLLRTVEKYSKNSAALIRISCEKCNKEAFSPLKFINEITIILIKKIEADDCQPNEIKTIISALEKACSLDPHELSLELTLIANSNNINCPHCTKNNWHTFLPTEASKKAIISNKAIKAYDYLYGEAQITSYVIDLYTSLNEKLLLIEKKDELNSIIECRSCKKESFTCRNFADEVLLFFAKKAFNETTPIQQLKEALCNSANNATLHQKLIILAANYNFDCSSCKKNMWQIKKIALLKKHS